MRFDCVLSLKDNSTWLTIFGDKSVRCLTTIHVLNIFNYCYVMYDHLFPFWDLLWNIEYFHQNKIMFNIRIFDYIYMHIFLKLFYFRFGIRIQMSVVHYKRQTANSFNLRYIFK